MQNMKPLMISIVRALNQDHFNVGELIALGSFVDSLRFKKQRENERALSEINVLEHSEAKLLMIA